MKNLLKKFDKIYLINLDQRKDRLKESMVILDKYELGDSLIRFSALTPPNNISDSTDGAGRKVSRGAYGLILSVVEIIKEAKKNNYKSILILEDDFDFLNEEYSEKVLEQLNLLNWDLFYFGANLHRNLNRISENIFKINFAYATHAVAYNNTVYDYFLEQFYENKIKILDVWLSENIQENFSCYCPWPILSIQRPSFSDIENVFTDYNFMERNYMKYTENI
jgi:GR25 family glycosyltransferase involved in LPS biosynthesis